MSGLYTKKAAAAYAQQRRADPEVTALLAAAIGLGTDGTYLDFGCGSGNYTRALAEKGGGWHGLDASEAMLGEAQNYPSGVSWQVGVAETLPYGEAYFDGTVSVLAAHHFTDLIIAMREAARVLKPDSGLAVFAATREQAQAFWLKDYFPTMIARDAQNLPPHAVYATALQQAGFQNISASPFTVNAATQDRFFYKGAAAPSFYLAADYRAASSVFRQAPPQELSNGLARLAADIDSGAIAAVMAKAMPAQNHQTNQPKYPVGHYTLFTACTPRA